MATRIERAVIKDQDFRDYATKKTTELNNESKWRIKGDFKTAILQVACDPFDHDKLSDLFNAVLGDYRSGLDHLVYDYANSRGLKANKTSFLIRDHINDIRSNVEMWEWPQNNTDDLVNFFDSVQPYKDSRYNSLKVLSQLRNTNEHRFIIVPTPIPNPKCLVHQWVSNGATIGKSMNPNMSFNKWAHKFSFDTPINEKTKFEHEILVRFEVEDSSRQNLIKVDVLSLLTDLKNIIPQIESDFRQKFLPATF